MQENLINDKDFYDEIRKKNAALWKKKSFANGVKRSWIAEKENIIEEKIIYHKKNTINKLNFLEPYKYSLRMSDKTENNISGLRNHLFNAIQKLEGGTMKAEEAKAMASLA